MGFCDWILSPFLANVMDMMHALWARYTEPTQILHRHGWILDCIRAVSLHLPRVIARQPDMDKTARWDSCL